MNFEKIKRLFLNFIFPRRCVICDEVLPFGIGVENEYVCKNCKNKIAFINNVSCKKCGAKLNNPNQYFCERCNSYLTPKEKGGKISYYDYGFGLCRYVDDIKESIHRLKYENRPEYIEFYGKCIATRFKNRFMKMCEESNKNELNINESNINVLNKNKLIKSEQNTNELNINRLNNNSLNNNKQEINELKKTTLCFVPVPIHKERMRERDYNQAEILAREISKELLKENIDIPVNTKLITRVKKTSSLNQLSETDRAITLKNAFKVSNELDENGDIIKSVCIVDDIYTTGSTIETMSKILKENGVEHIYFVTIAVVDNL